jgi:DNA-directed RNA polymerase subunit RPC12/RpoP
MEGPQDRALYICRCGSAFQAAVTASVRCPHCGELQAW